MLLVDRYRELVGRDIRGYHHGRHIGFTTNEEAATALLRDGATVLTCYNRPPGPVGWEVAFLDGAEVTTPEQRAAAA